MPLSPIQGSVLEAVDALRLVAHDPAVVELDDARIWSTMPASWVAITTVVPVRLIRSSSFMMPTEVVGSRLPVGSSAMRIIGRFTNARATWRPLLLAAGELVGRRSPFALQAHELQRLRDQLRDLRPRPADHLLGERDVLGSRSCWEQPEVLEDGADLAPQPRTFQLASRLTSLPAT